jgi:hypothetical protein
MRRSGSARGSRAAVLILALVAVAVVGGCEYLYGYDMTDPGDFPPAPIATFIEGSAGVTIGDDAEMTLGELGGAAMYGDEWLGGEATFSNGDGWYLRVSGIATGSVFGSSAFVTLDRVSGGQHWTTYDPSRCIVTIETADANGMRGTATCKGLRWTDAIGAYGMSLEPNYITGEDPFDAEIRFEALPASTTPA